MKKTARRQQWLAPRMLIGWLCLIFFTSCFVVPFDTFIRFIQNLSGSPNFRQWFNQFWVGDWFFVVKGWHMTEYAILTSLIIIALGRSRPGNRLSSIWFAFAFAVVFAASDEWHQTFVPGRDGNVRDVLIDAGGAFLASLCWLALFQHEKRKDLAASVPPHD